MISKCYTHTVCWRCCTVYLLWSYSAVCHCRDAFVDHKNRK